MLEEEENSRRVLVLLAEETKEIGRNRIFIVGFLFVMLPVDLDGRRELFTHTIRRQQKNANAAK